MPELKTSNNPWLDESFNKNTVIPDALGFNIEDIVERLGIDTGDSPTADLFKHNFLKLTDTPNDYGQQEQFAQTDGLGNISWAHPHWVKAGSNIYYTKGKAGVKTTRPIADFDVNGSIASRDLTAGSVPFIKANSIFTDANDKFYWHDASKQLNVGDYDISIFDDYYDYFDDGTVGAEWSTHNTDANRTIVEAGTKLTITVAASTDARWSASVNEAPKLYKAVPSPPFEFIARFAAYAMPTNNVEYGIFIGHYDADQSNEKFAHKFGKIRAGDGSKYIQVNRVHSQGGLESGSDIFSAMDEDAILWFKITVDESEDVRYYVSDDMGSSWTQMQKSSADYAWSGFFDSGMEIGFFLAGNVASETVAIFSGTTIEQAASDSIIAKSFKLTDGDASNILKMRWNESDSSDRILNLKVEGGNRTLDLYENLTIGNGYDVTIIATGQANTFTMNESFTIGDGNAGTLIYSAASKTLTVEDNSLVNQDLTTDASGVQFTSLNLVGGSLNISGASALYAKIDSNSTARFIADAHDADAYTEYQEDGTLKWTAGYDYSDGKYKICEGVPGTNLRLEIIVGGSMNVYDTAAAHFQIVAGSSGTARLIADSHTNDAYVELKEQTVTKWTAGFDYTDSNAYVISEGAPGTNNRFKIAAGGNVIIGGTLSIGEITVIDGSGINLQEDITFTGATGENLLKVPDNLLDAWSLQEGSNKYMTIDTIDDEEDILFYKSVDILHTATHADDHALEIDTDAAGYGDVKAIDLDYITGSISAGEDEAIILINIDEIAATGGEVFGLEVLATDQLTGSTGLHGLKVGPLIAPIHQDSGVFINPTFASDDTPTTDVPVMRDGLIANTTAIFDADSDYIIIGAATAFQDIELIFSTASSKDIKPTFWYSIDGGSNNFTQFTPVDGTDGCRHTGVISWDASDLSNHVADGTTGTFNIKIIRTKGGSFTTPVLGYAKTAATTEYVWDKDGVLTWNGGGSANANTAYGWGDHSGANSDITSMSGITGTIATPTAITMSDGGTVGNATAYINFDGSNSWLEITGNVAIGKAIPVDNLDVYGGLTLTRNMAFDAGIPGRIYKSALHGLTFVGVTGTSYDFTFATAIGQLFIVNPTGTKNLSLNPLSGGNVGLGTVIFGTSAEKNLALATGVAPTSSPADCFQMYSADIVADHAAMHIRNENDTIIKLYQQPLVNDPAGQANDLDSEARTAINSILDILENNGLMANA